MFVDLERVFAKYGTEDLARDLTKAKIPWSRVNDVYSVAKLPAIQAKMTATRAPDGRLVALQPLPVDGESSPRELTFPPRYGEHTTSLLREIGIDDDEVGSLVADGTVFAAQE
jgi:crotonobetainyl-CoA:carnitine CoA-transferase CaiB-like acyl-CoA transferase